MTSPQAQLTRDLTDLSVGAPYVAASRIARLSMPGALASSREQREMIRMVVEKQTAAIESFFSLAVAYQQQVVKFWLGAAFIQPFSLASERQVIATTRAALKPYRARVNENARRIKRRSRKP